MRDRFGASGSVSAKNLTCSEVTAFDDANGDFVVTDDEIGAPVSCGG